MNVFSNAFSENPKEVEKPTDDKPEVETVEAEKPETVETKEPAASSAAKEPETEAEKPEETAQRDETGRFTKTVPHQALHAERLRREAVERELQELRSQQTKPPTSVLDDEDKAFNERLTQAMAPVRKQIFEQSIEYAREKPGREDFDEVYAFMEQEITAHPELMQQILTASRPGEVIYQLGKTRKELAEVGGDLTKYREHLTAQQAKLLSEKDQRIKALEAQLAERDASKKKRTDVPESLNTEQSASVKGGDFAGPTPLRTVFNS